ncbi:MAG TPA: hypothetical protein VJR89_14395 [Polyangiales bacterium]|nr:hypothetical protein [Polyangiales bacterium]
MRRPTAPAVRELGTITGQLLNALGGSTKVSYIHLIPFSLRLPDSEARAALQEITRDYGQHTACVGVVVSGSGFWASAVRGIVTGVQVIAPKSIDLRIHAQSSELLGWFPREHQLQTGVAIQGTELLRMIESTTARQRASLPAARASSLPPRSVG